MNVYESGASPCHCTARIPTTTSKGNCPIRTKCAPGWQFTGRCGISPFPHRKKSFAPLQRLTIRFLVDNSNSNDNNAGGKSSHWIGWLIAKGFFYRQGIPFFLCRSNLLSWRKVTIMVRSLCAMCGNWKNSDLLSTMPLSEVTTSKPMVSHMVFSILILLRLQQIDTRKINGEDSQASELVLFVANI